MSGAILSTPVPTTPSTSDPVSPFVEIANAIKTGADQGAKDAVEIQTALGLNPPPVAGATPADDSKKAAGVVVLVVSALLLVGATALVIWFVHKAKK